MATTLPFDSLVTRNQPVAPVNLPGEIWGITTYFNPAGYINKKTHLRLFSERVRAQGLKLLVVELTFGTSGQVIEEALADLVIRLSSSTVLWQKERLLNIAIKHLPKTCDKVVWLDADILFANDQWVKEASSTLHTYAIVQPFDQAWWLSRESGAALSCTVKPFSEDTALKWQQDSIRSAPGVAYAQMQGTLNSSYIFKARFGHHGFAWAARRSLLELCGLYDRCILGGADSIITWAMFGCFEPIPAQELLANLRTSDAEQSNRRAQYFIQGTRGLVRRFTRAQVLDIIQWSHRLYSEIQGNVSFVPGAIYHLWHGSISDRQYGKRLAILKEADFNPSADISLDVDECWQWNTDKPELHRRVKEYFSIRSEESE